VSGRGNLDALPRGCCAAQPYFLGAEPLQIFSLVANDLTKALLDEINAHLAEQGLLMHARTIVDATIIAAPSSTKQEGNARNPEMHQTKKGNQWHFGMKATPAWTPRRGWCIRLSARRVTSTT